MLTLPIEPEEVEIARDEAKRMGPLRGTIVGVPGNFAGVIGELAVARVLGYLGARRDNSYEHDITVAGWRFDVKTKRRSGKPATDFVGTVPVRQVQDCHGYIFTSVEMDRKENPVSVTICGWQRKDRFLFLSEVIEAGVMDPSNGWVCKESCRNIPYSKLDSVFDLECHLMLALRGVK